ncbi:hypothetical protein HOG98_01320 [bacterium]|nr:hypothetical protein [bacterium]
MINTNTKQSITKSNDSLSDYDHAFFETLFQECEAENSPIQNIYVTRHISTIQTLTSRIPNYNFSPQSKKIMCHPSKKGKNWLSPLYEEKLTSLIALPDNKKRSSSLLKFFHTVDQFEIKINLFDLFVKHIKTTLSAQTSDVITNDTFTERILFDLSYTSLFLDEFPYWKTEMNGIFVRLIELCSHCKNEKETAIFISNCPLYVIAGILGKIKNFELNRHYIKLLQTLQYHSEKDYGNRLKYAFSKSEKEAQKTEIIS